jgi:hypothetical protein
MKLTKKDIEPTLLKKLPVYYHTLKKIETEGLDTFLDNQKINFISINQMNEPMYFPSLYRKPISKI